MNEKNNLEEYENSTEFNNNDNSILSVYANVKKMNNFKNLIAENNEEILKEISKHDKKIAVIEGELNLLQNNVDKTENVTTNDIQDLEKKLNNDIINIVEEKEKETNETVEKLIKKIEENKKDSEEQINKLIIDFNNQLEDINKRGQELFDSLNATKEDTNNSVLTNIESLKNIIIESEKNNSSKIENLQNVLNDKLETTKKENKKIIAKSLEGINVEEIKNNISNLEELNTEKIQSLEDSLNKKIYDENAKTESILLDNIKNSVNEIQKNVDVKIGEKLEENNSLVFNNIEELKNNIIKSETLYNEKIEQIEESNLNNIEELKKVLEDKLQDEKEANAEMIANSLEALKIEEIKESILNIEALNTDEIQKLEESLDKKISDKNAKTESILFANIKNLKNNINEFQKNIDNKIGEKLEENNSIFFNNLEELKNIETANSEKLTQSEENVLNKIQVIEQDLNTKLEIEKKESKELLAKSIEELNIEEIKNDISNLETSNASKIQELENSINQIIIHEKEKIETSISNNTENIKNEIIEFENNINQKIIDLDYFETIRKLENSTQDLKEQLLNNEYFSKTLSKKIEELDSINQKKLDKVKKEQEKFIINKIEELNTNEETDNIKSDLKEISQKMQDIEALINNVKEKSSIEMQNYVEKLILRMKFTTTIQLIVKEINELKKKISLLQNAEEDDDEVNSRIENIIKQKLQKQEKEIMANIDAIVEEKVQEALKEIIRKQKVKKAMQNEIQKKQTQKNNILSNEITKMPNKKRANSSPSSLDDMVATLSNLPTSKSKNIAKKSISTITKATKKSQILNSDNY